ncbi:MAG TPA: gliding motility-associated C-terminal domain-containing protein [Bacteroidales bacterium]|nr:gliding motility-associated C-terminal domain-containing protein [Bacteroidales bacterium]
MSSNINSGPKNFDDYLKNMLDNYQPDVSSNLWSSLKLKLFKKDFWDFVSFKKLIRSFTSQPTLGVVQIKTLVSYAVAACFTVALVFGANYVYNNLVKDTPKNNVDTGKTIVSPVKLKLDILNKLPQTETPQHILVTPVPVKQHDQTKNNPVAITDNKAPVNTTNPVVPTNTSVNNIPEKTDVHTKLLNYIDRINSKDKTVIDEPVTQEYPDNIDINITDSSGIVREENENFAYNLEIPNVFTPNNDGYNDNFVIKNLDKYPFNSLTIADRKGKVVFEAINYQNNWDARNVDAGTYYYILNYKDSRNNQGVIKGIISVIR